MIPELGHFALILALLVAAAQGIVPMLGASLNQSRMMALARPAARMQFFLVATAFACLAWSFAVQRFFGAERRRQLQLGVAAPLPHRGDLGFARRIAVAVDADAGRLELRRVRLFAQSSRRTGGARPVGDGPDQRRLPAVPAVHVESIRAADPGRGRRTRPESAAAGSGHGLPSAAALHGLRRLFGRVLVCIGGADRRPARRNLGALVATLDDGRVGIPDDRHRLGQRLGLLHARLGRVVVLGPGRKCVLHALADRYGADPFACSDREARRFPQLDSAARDSRLFAVAARHLPRALGRSYLGARLRDRSGPRRVHPRFSRDRHRRLARAVRMARRRRGARRLVRAGFARIDAARQ